MEQKLKKIMADIFEISIDQIDESATMENIELWDSLTHIKLMMGIEENFGIRLETEEIIKMTSFKDIKRILSTKGIKF